MSFNELTMAQLLRQSLQGMSELELAEFARAVVAKRSHIESAVKALKSVETAVKLQAKNTFMVGQERMDLNYGSFTRSERSYMKLPETGWASILPHLVQQVNDGGDPVEVFDMVSLSLKTAHFKDMTPDELPLGITRDVKTDIKFNPKKA